MVPRPGWLQIAPTIRSPSPAETARSNTIRPFFLAYRSGIGYAGASLSVTMYDADMDVETWRTGGGGRLTYDDLAALPDDGLRHEIIDGVHYVTPSPNLRHQELLGRLHFEIEGCLRRHAGIGRVFVAPLDVVFTKYDVVEPDLLFVARDQQDDVLTAANVQGAPALVIEILSPGTRTRDEGVKRQLFDRGGVREYWLVDPDERTVRIWRAEKQTFAAPLDLMALAEDAIESPLLPGFSLPLPQIFS